MIWFNSRDEPIDMTASPCFQVSHLVGKLYFLALFFGGGAFLSSAFFLPMAAQCSEQDAHSRVE